MSHRHISPKIVERKKKKPCLAFGVTVKLLCFCLLLSKSYFNLQFNVLFKKFYNSVFEIQSDQINKIGKLFFSFVKLALDRNVNFLYRSTLRSF